MPAEDTMGAGPGLVVLLLADIRGYTRFTNERGDEAGACLAVRFAELAERAAATHGGRVVEVRGDEVLATFASARGALRAAASLQALCAAHATDDLPLRAGIGLDAGEPVPLGDGYRGEALNVAARLCALAGPGQVLASESVLHLARRVEGLIYEDRGAVELKGLSQPVRVGEVRWAAVAELPDAGQEQPPTLVGRSHEQAVLRERLALALAGHGSVALIGGEAGIGKTTLAEALIRQARAQGSLVLTGHAYDLTDTPPYGPWTELLGQSPPTPDLPSLPAVLASGSAASQAALFAGVRNVLATLAARQPLVLCLEDLHWADPASLDLLRFLARQLTTLPLLLVATYRADELSRRHPLFSRLPLLVREAQALRVDLRRLGDEAVRTLVGTRYRLAHADEARLVAYLQTRAEGNPLFIGELLRTLEEEELLQPGNDGWRLGALERVRVPSFLRQVIESRLARLGEAARGLLAVAAVIGQEVSLDLWREVTTTADEELLDAVERAVEMRLLEEAPNSSGVRFVHALIREALYEGLLAARRQAWHRRIGEALFATPRPDPDLVAYHFRQAGDARAVAWLIRAGERAQRAYAWLTAVDRFEAALALMPSDGATEDRGGLLVRLAWLRRYAAPHQAVRYLDEALRLATTDQDQALKAAAQYFRGFFRCYTGDMRDGLDEMAGGVAAVGALSRPDRARLRLLGVPGLMLGNGNGRQTLALWRALVGRYREARPLVEEALAQQTAGTASVLGLGASTHGDAYQCLGIVHAAQGRPIEARRAFTQARDAFRTAEHHFQVATTAAWEIYEVLLPYQADRPAERQYLAAEAEQAWIRSSGVWADAFPALARLPLLFLAGDWADARRMALEACIPDGIINQRLFAIRMLGPLAYHQGDTDLVWAQVRAVLPDGPRTEPGNTWLLSALLLQRMAAALAIEAEDLTTARAWLEAHDRWLDWSGATQGRAEGHLGWAVYHRAAGQPALAHTRAATALAQALEPRQPLALLAAHRLLGELDTAAGRPSDAAAHLDTALELAQACAVPHERALTLLALAELRAMTGQQDEARRLLEEVRAICTPLGAAPTLAQAERLTARLSATATPRPRYPAGLSGREVEVLRLVADGLSNAEVAERLVLSPRTVEQHLRSIYNKLGVSSRAAATRFAVEHQLS